MGLRNKKKELSKKSLLTVIKKLEKYGSPNHGNKKNPLNEVVYIILSKQTNDAKFQLAYKRLKTNYRSFSKLNRAPTKRIIKLIKFSGFENQKASHIKEVLAKIKKDFGKLSLSFLRNWENDKALRYLLALPGIGLKSAYCVLMYSLNKKVLPVDTHVYRISTRLGLIPNGISSKKAHELLEEIIPPSKRYSFHVNCVSHGRQICRTSNPLCYKCMLQYICSYGTQKLS